MSSLVMNLVERAEKAEAERDELFRKWSASKSNREKDLEARVKELEGEMRKAIEATEFQCSERPPCGQEDCPACAIAHFMKQTLKRKK